ncbi:MAG: tetratricopeptide repeat protein [Kiritimatiellae bacterium]|nr:tetratricopeptide repeat protein [Kiritimatiellia bacterium]
MVCICFVAVAAWAELPETESDATPEQLKQMAEQYEGEGDLLGAATAYEQAIAKDPTMREALAPRLVGIYLDQHMEPEAVKWAEVAMEKHGDPQSYLAGIYVSLGNLDEAERVLKALITQPGAHQQVLTRQWQLMDVYEKQGRADEAEQLLIKSLDTVPSGPFERAAWFQLLRFYRRHGDLESHVEEWRRAAAENPSDPWLQRALPQVDWFYEKHGGPEAE